MQLDLREVLAEFHGIGKRPLMGSDLAQGSSHEDCAYFVYDQEFCDVVGVGPHDGELLGSSVTVEFSDAIRIANSHDIKHAIESRTDTLTILIPHLEQLLPLAIHDHTTSIRKHPLDEQVLIQERNLLDHIARIELDRIHHLVLVRIYDDHLIERTSHQLMPVSGVPDCLAILHRELDVGRLQALRTDDEELQALL